MEADTKPAPRHITNTKPRTHNAAVHSAVLSAVAQFLRPMLKARASKVRPVVMGGRVYQRYSGAHLRAIRAIKGVGRPPQVLKARRGAV